jgi:hypothetical protein
MKHTPQPSPSRREENNKALSSIVAIALIGLASLLMSIRDKLPALIDQSQNNRTTTVLVNGRQQTCMVIELPEEMKDKTYERSKKKRREMEKKWKIFSLQNDLRILREARIEGRHTKSNQTHKRSVFEYTDEGERVAIGETTISHEQAIRDELDLLTGTRTSYRERERSDKESYLKRLEEERKIREKYEELLGTYNDWRQYLRELTADQESEIKRASEEMQKALQRVEHEEEELKKQGLIVR